MGLFPNQAFLLLIPFFIVTWEAAAMATSTQPTMTASPPSGSKENFGRVFYWKTKVTINNNLTEGLELTVHCKSRDDDLGVHVIPDGNHYEWSFHINFWQTTLFFCGLSYRDGSGVYDIYKALRDLSVCPNECQWNITSDGLFGYYEGFRREEVSMMYKWGKPLK